ncbi:MAG: hypothetical protein ABIE42_04800 [Candidatus Eisenbacteria bacterium]
MRRGITFMALCLVAALVLGGCATTYKYSYPGCKAFTDENVGQLRVGMPYADAVALFGDPDEQYVSEFGADAGEPWTGRALVYFTELDKELKYAKRYKKNVLMFHPSEGEMKLNHWELEQ